MSKYEPLTNFLKVQKHSSVRLTTREVERILGFDLPKSARLYTAWWSNSDSSHVQAAAWLSAGYETTNVDLADGKVTFARAPKEGLDAGEASPPSTRQELGRHPLFGVWKGKVTLVPDYDYTQPADPDWGKTYDE